MIPAWVSILWDLRDYFFSIERFLNDPSFQQEACTKALEIAPIIVGEPGIFLIYTIFTLYCGIILLHIPYPELNISSGNSLVENTLIFIMKKIYIVAYVFIYSRALDLFIFLLAIESSEIVMTTEIMK
ncbi:hypothetical protein [Sporomusa sp. KB1]|jgi:hypothetical protein|uniref:hypothetical protein n=1 Tax=Sporomusa sp. KB1 TaxID=943346 RepID=UPI0011A17A75|nr:hypothetical protein [Sporomusa sp. KB1]TWH48538.1 hypothetical protein Salpa_4702 [Sporomusa sp. KB1]